MADEDRVLCSVSDDGKDLSDFAPAGDHIIDAIADELNGSLTRQRDPRETTVLLSFPRFNGKLRDRRSSSFLPFWEGGRADPIPSRLCHMNYAADRSRIIASSNGCHIVLTSQFFWADGRQDNRVSELDALESIAPFLSDGLRFPCERA
jgi:hypothetical protein